MIHYSFIINLMNDQFWRKVRYGRPVRMVRVRFPGQDRPTLVDPLEHDEQYRRLRVDEDRFDQHSLNSLHWDPVDDGTSPLN